MAARDLSLREKRLIQAAILLAIIVLVSLLFRGGDGDTAPIPARVGPGLPAPSPAPVAVAPRTPAMVPSPVVATPPPPVAAADLSQLRLYGLLASGAVIGYANGGQRLVPVGREAVPGLTLVRLEQNYAILQGPAGEVRLGFDGVAPGGGN